MRRLLATGLACALVTCLLLPAATAALNSTEVSLSFLFPART